MCVGPAAAAARRWTNVRLERAGWRRSGPAPAAGAKPGDANALQQGGQPGLVQRPSQTPGGVGIVERHHGGG